MVNALVRERERESERERLHTRTNESTVRTKRKVSKNSEYIIFKPEVTKLLIAGIKRHEL